jgi:hypothetical protein
MQKYTRSGCYSFYLLRFKFDYRFLEEAVPFVMSFGLMSYLKNN